MSDSPVPLPFSAPLRAVQNVLAHFHNRGIVIGGIAVSLLGKERATADIDAIVLLTLDDIPDLLAVAAREGLSPRIADVATFARRSRVVLLQHEPSGINVDLSLGALPFESQAVARSTFWVEGDLRIPLPTPEDLVILKAVAHRSKDRDDIEGIMTRHPGLDWRRIEHWVRQFADVLEMPELWTDLAQLRDQRQSGSRKDTKSQR